MSDTKNTVFKVISEQVYISEKDIFEEAHLKNDLNLDSLDMSELAMALEDEFDIEITDVEMNEIEIVGDIIKAINRKIE